MTIKVFGKPLKKSYYSDKQKSTKNNIFLVEERINSIISIEIEVAEKLNNFFADTIKKLDIMKYIRDKDQRNVDVCEIIDRYSQHSSIIKINEYIEKNDMFDFTKVTTEEEQRNVDVCKIIDRCSQHSSIIKINEYIETNDMFDFTKVTTEEMKIGIKKLKSNKATATDDIPARILIKSQKITSIYLTKNYNK